MHGGGGGGGGESGGSKKNGISNFIFSPPPFISLCSHCSVTESAVGL